MFRCYRSLRLAILWQSTSSISSSRALIALAEPNSSGPVPSFVWLTKIVDLHFQLSLCLVHTCFHHLQGHDDAVALLLALELPEINLLGVSTVRLLPSPRALPSTSHSFPLLMAV